MKRFVGLVGALGIAATLPSAAALIAQAGTPAPTFNQDVAPVLLTHCASCHRPGEVAPMSLLTYAETRPYAAAIKRMVESRRMPPWPADPQFGEFKNNHRLSDAEIKTLVAWAESGAPQGLGDPPAPPVFPSGWGARLDRPPDLTIETPFTFDVPATGIVPTFTVWMKLPIREEKFVQAIELREDRGRRASKVIDADLLDARIIQDILLERVRQSNAAHHDMLVRQRRFESGVEAHALQRASRCDGHRHAAEGTAAGGFRGVDVGMGVQPQHADAEWIPARPRLLQAGHEAWHRRTRGQQADGEIAVRLILPDHVGKIA